MELNTIIHGDCLEVLKQKELLNRTAQELQGGEQAKAMLFVRFTFQ